MTPYARPYVRLWHLTTLRKALRKVFLKTNDVLRKALRKALRKRKMGRDPTALQLTKHLSLRRSIVTYFLRTRYVD